MPWRRPRKTELGGAFQFAGSAVRAARPARRGRQVRLDPEDVELMFQEREAYRQARVLLGAICAFSAHEQQSVRLDQLRHLAVEAVSPILASASQQSGTAHVAALRRSHAALDRLAELLEECRSSGVLPSDQAGDLLHVQGDATRAVDRAIADYELST